MFSTLNCECWNSCQDDVSEGQQKRSCPVLQAAQMKLDGDFQTMAAQTEVTWLDAHVVKNTQDSVSE